MNVLQHFADLVLQLDKHLEPMIRQYGTTVYVIALLVIVRMEAHYTVGLRALGGGGAVYDARTSDRSQEQWTYCSTSSTSSCISTNTWT